MTVDYHIAGKFGEIGKLSAIHQTKLVLTINNLLVDLLIRQTFPLYSIKIYQVYIEALAYKHIN